MRRFRPLPPLPALFTFLLFLGSCQSLGNRAPAPAVSEPEPAREEGEEFSRTGDPPVYRPLPPANSPAEPEGDPPLPELGLSAYFPVISAASVSVELPALPLPPYREEAAALPVPLPSPRTDFPGETPRLAVPRRYREPDPSPEAEAGEPVGPTPAPVEPEPQPAKPTAEEIATVPVRIPPLREETLAAGDIALLDLEGADWYFLREEEGNEADFVDRTTMDGKTFFSFKFPGVGTYRLIFQRQNHRTGDMEQGEILVQIREGEGIEVTDAPPQAATPAGGEENPVSVESAPDLSRAAERLEEIEDDPDRVEETLDLLKFLVDASSDDESLAEYYYRMARTLEMNTRFQDLRRAYETYEYIEETFFLTDYYEKAVERIRYLDRHFFKLR